MPKPNLGGIEPNGWYEFGYKMDNNELYAEQYETLEELISAKLIDGKSLIELWDKLEYL